MSYNVTCPYCGQPAILVTGEVIYPAWTKHHHKTYYLCSPCKAYVGTHANSDDEPLGTPAKKERRQLRSAAHKALDPIAKRRGDRNATYNWLAKKMNITPDKCHIGMFDEKQCEQVLDICGEARLKVAKALRGGEKIFRDEGMNVEKFRTIQDPHAAWLYLMKEFIPNAPSSEELMKLMAEAGNSSTNFVALVWARKNPTDPFAIDIEKQLGTINPHTEEVEF